MEATEVNQSIFIKVKTWFSTNKVLSMYMVTSWIFYLLYLVAYQQLFSFTHFDIWININGYCLSMVFLILFSLVTTTNLKKIISWPFRWSIICSVLLMVFAFFEASFLQKYSTILWLGYILTLMCTIGTGLLSYFVFKTPMKEDETIIDKLAEKTDKLDTENEDVIATAGKELGGKKNGK